MATHPAVVTTTPNGPLELHLVPTPALSPNDLKIINHYTASTPLDLHQAAGHLLVNPPQVIGDGFAGTVLEVGSAVKRYKPGDEVFGFSWRNQAEKAHQLYVVAPENLAGRIPPNHSMQEAVTLPNNFVTVWHFLTHDLGFELPWVGGVGKPEWFKPWEGQLRTANGGKKWIVVWGGSSSCGMYTLQVLKYYGYENVIAIASGKHHEMLKRYGATECFDYRGEGDVVERVKEFAKKDGGEVGYIVDCIGSFEGSVKPVARIAEAKGCRVAILLPVIVKDVSEHEPPVYEMDVTKGVEWREGVVPIGVRTHFWLDNKQLAETLETEIMPWALETGIVEPNEQVIVEGATLLERAQKAIDMLRDKKVSGGRLVWKVAEDEEIKEALEQIERR